MPSRHLSLDHPSDARVASRCLVFVFQKPIWSFDFYKHHEFIFISIDVLLWYLMSYSCNKNLLLQLYQRQLTLLTKEEKDLRHIPLMSFLPDHHNTYTLAFRWFLKFSNSGDWRNWRFLMCILIMIMSLNEFWTTVQFFDY